MFDSEVTLERGSGARQAGGEPPWCVVGGWWGFGGVPGVLIIVLKFHDTGGRFPPLLMEDVWGFEFNDNTVVRISSAFLQLEWVAHLSSPTIVLEGQYPWPTREPWCYVNKRCSNPTLLFVYSSGDVIRTTRDKKSTKCHRWSRSTFQYCKWHQYYIHVITLLDGSLL